MKKKLNKNNTDEEISFCWKCAKIYNVSKPAVKFIFSQDSSGQERQKQREGGSSLWKAFIAVR